MAINGLLLAGVAEEIGATRVRAPAVEIGCDSLRLAKKRSTTGTPPQGERVGGQGPPSTLFRSGAVIRDFVHLRDLNVVSRGMTRSTRLGLVSVGLAAGRSSNTGADNRNFVIDLLVQSGTIAQQSVGSSVLAVEDVSAGATCHTATQGEAGAATRPRRTLIRRAALRIRAALRSRIAYSVGTTFAAGGALRAGGGLPVRSLRARAALIRRALRPGGDRQQQ